MVNGAILEEQEKNKRGHNIFDYQKSEDLQELEELLKENDSQLVITIDGKEWSKACFLIVYEETKQQEIEACRKYIAAKILTELSKTNEKLKQYHGEEQLQIFRTKDKKQYRQKKDSFLNMEDALDIINIENIPIDRIHFIIKVNQSEVICDALTLYLQDKLPFSISVYHIQSSFYTIRVPESNLLLWQAYNYKRYNGIQEAQKVKRKK